MPRTRKWQQVVALIEGGAGTWQVATYVYCADQAVTRGGSDVEGAGENWRRKLYFRIPVRNPDLWNGPAVLGLLQETLSFVSEDEYYLEFEGLKDGPTLQQYLKFSEDASALVPREEVVLFSGGVDSLGGAVDEAVVHGRKVATLIRHRNSQMRDPRREACSLNECIDDGEGGTVERVQTIAAEEADRRLGRQARSDQETVELALDVEEVLNRLPDNLRGLCELLKTGSIADAARAMGVPRMTLNDHVKKLREFFEAAGLRDYLAGRPSSGECAG